MFVSKTDSEIVGRGAENEFSFLVSKSNRILACIKGVGGECPAPLPSSATYSFPDRSGHPALKASALRAILGAAKGAPSKNSDDVSLTNLSTFTVAQLAGLAKLNE